MYDNDAWYADDDDERDLDEERRRSLDDRLFEEDEFTPLMADSDVESALAEAASVEGEETYNFPFSSDETEGIDLNAASYRVRETQRPPQPRREYAPDERFPPVSPRELRAVEQPRRSQPAPPPKRGRNLLANFATVLFLLATVGMAAFVFIVFRNPLSPINLLAPPTPFIEISATPQPTGTPTLEPTATTIPSATPQPSRTSTPVPAANAQTTPGTLPNLFDVLNPQSTAPTDDAPQATTAVPVLQANTATFTPTESTPDATATATPLTPLPEPDVFPFHVSPVGVVYTTNDNDAGCEWSSIAGTVTGEGSTPLRNFNVQIRGESTDEIVISGSAPDYGPSGFELPLGDEPTQAQYFVRLIDPSGVPASEETMVITSALCDQNVAVINFVPNTP